MTNDIKRALSERWTVLHQDPRRKATKGSVVPVTAKGVAPETWLCVDCGVHTAPGMMNRKEVDAALIIHGVANQTLTWDQEVYTVIDEVWRATGLEQMGGCLCIGCLEKRIGRRLKPEDFLAGHPFNAPDFPASLRLQERRGAA